MYPHHVRTVEQRLADTSWTRPKSWLLLVPLLSLGTLTFVWFWMRANLDDDGDKGRYELWAWVWGLVAVGGGTLGGAGLFFGTADEIAVSSIIWILRVTSVVHAWAMNQRRLERIARREVGVEVSMIAAAQARGARPGQASRFPTSHLPTSAVPDGYDPRLAASFPQVYTGTEEPAGQVAPVPQAPPPPRPAPPVDPAASRRVLEPLPPTRPAPPGGVPFDGVPDVEPEPTRWMPTPPPRPGQPRSSTGGRKLDL